jgi:hypothetical protein
MIVDPEWLKPKEKPYFHQISINCLEKLVAWQERFNKGEIDADTSFYARIDLYYDLPDGLFGGNVFYQR